MPRCRLLSSLVLNTVLAFAIAGCAMDTEPGETGALSLELVLADDVTIDAVEWRITGNGMDMSDSINVSAPGSTASVEVFGLPRGDEMYTIALEAVSVDGAVTCRGSEPFNVEAGETTDVMVILSCKLPQQLGAVRVNGKFNICAELAKAVVSPLQTSVGNNIGLSAQGVDRDNDPIIYTWTGSGGSIANPSAASTTYTCQEVGNHFVNISVTDNDEACDMSQWTIPVSCVAGDGGTGGAGGAGGAGGMGGTGGVLMGNCTTEENQAVYDELTFTNGKGETTTGTEAASAIGSECVRGSTSSVPPVEGCGTETFAVVACFPDCDEPTVQALADCTAACTGDTIEEITGSTLTEDCLECTGNTVACGAAFCTSECLADTTAQVCIDCRCENDCTPQFVICSGFPSDSMCDVGAFEVQQ